MKLWKIEKCEIEDPNCPGCNIEIKPYHTEHQVLSLDERLLIGIMKDFEALKTGDNILLRITLVDNNVKVEDGT